MASTFHHHVAAACEGAGMEPSDLPAVIDEHAFSAVWGSAFEDLLARDQPDGRNIVDDYLMTISSAAAGRKACPHAST